MSEPILTPPPLQIQVDDQKNKKIAVPWIHWLQNLYTSFQGLSRSGTTDERPTSNLWLGQVYFDTTLGQPVVVTSLDPVTWKKITVTV